MKLVTDRMTELSVIVLRHFTTSGKTQYEGSERITPTHDEAVSAARELKALLADDTKPDPLQTRLIDDGNAASYDATAAGE